eukprot:gene7360-15027_t
MAEMSSPFEDPSVKAVSNPPPGLSAPSGTSWPPKAENAKSTTPSMSNSINASSMIQNPIIQHAVTQAAIKAISNGTTMTNNDDDASVSGSEISIPVGIVELKEIEQWAKRLRVAYMAISTIMALAAFLSLGSNDLGVMFMALYVWFFALLIFCSELALKGVAKLIAENFGFMYNPVGRLVFMLFVAVMCYELGLLGKIVMAMLTVASFVHFYVIIIHPAFEEYVRKKHYYNVQLSAATDLWEHNPSNQTSIALAKHTCQWHSLLRQARLYVNCHHIRDQARSVVLSGLAFPLQNIGKTVKWRITAR